jgi:hypothetical protein
VKLDYNMVSNTILVFDQADPFKSLDDLAVGSLLSTGISKCREARPGMDCAILDGDHTSDPRYQLFHFWILGLSGVACCETLLQCSLLQTIHSSIPAKCLFSPN